MSEYQKLFREPLMFLLWIFPFICLFTGIRMLVKALLDMEVHYLDDPRYAYWAEKGEACLGIGLIASAAILFHVLYQGLLS